MVVWLQRRVSLPLFLWLHCQAPKFPNFSKQKRLEIILKGVNIDNDAFISANIFLRVARLQLCSLYIPSLLHNKEKLSWIYVPCQHMDCQYHCFHHVCNAKFDYISLLPHFKHTFHKDVFALSHFSCIFAPLPCDQLLMIQ